MTVMPPEHTPDVAHAGLRIKKRILVALTLASVVPVLVLAFVVLVLILPTLGPGESVKFGGLQLLVLFTIVGMLAGVAVWVGLVRRRAPRTPGEVTETEHRRIEHQLADLEEPG